VLSASRWRPILKGGDHPCSHGVTEAKPHQRTHHRHRHQQLKGEREAENEGRTGLACEESNDAMM